jgi:pyruvate,water dikinase
MNETHASCGHIPAFLEQLASTDRSLVGDKAVVLGSLARCGFAVPDGFVLTSGSDAEISAAYHQLEQRTGRPAVPVAVRLSLVAGERVAGPPHPAETNVRGAPAVIAAIERRRAAEATPTAVIVQEMAAGERAGIVYTVDPVRRDDGVVRVTAGFGADTSWSSPHDVDTYAVSRRTGELMQAVIVPKGGRLGQHRRVLSDDEAVDVAATARGVEQCLGGPQAVDYLLDRAGRTIVLKASPLEWNSPGAAVA